MKIAYAPGCNDVSCGDDSGFADAVAAAKGADAVIVTLGLDFFGGAADESEGHDRDTIELVGKQADLVAALRAATKVLWWWCGGGGGGHAVGVVFLGGS